MASDEGEFRLHPDAWLSTVLDVPTFSARPEPGGENLQALADRAPLFAYAKVDVRQVAAQHALNAFGFRVVDTALVFAGQVAAAAAPARDTIRPATADDRAAVMSIAGHAFRYSRFHLDPQVSARQADDVKVAWVANFFNGGRGDGMLVAERNGGIAGFLLLKWGKDGQLLIDLIGVAPACQRSGVGGDLIRRAARDGTGDGRRPESILVGTQAANTPSVRLYEALGLRLSAAQHVLHFHAS